MFSGQWVVWIHCLFFSFSQDLSMIREMHFSAHSCWTSLALCSHKTDTKMYWKKLIASFLILFSGEHFYIFSLHHVFRWYMNMLQWWLSKICFITSYGQTYLKQFLIRVCYVWSCIIFPIFNWYWSNKQWNGFAAWLIWYPLW